MQSDDLISGLGFLVETPLVGNFSLRQIKWKFKPFHCTWSSSSITPTENEIYLIQEHNVLALFYNQIQIVNFLLNKAN